MYNPGDGITQRGAPWASQFILGNA
jgi:hypothetical protein